MPGAQTGASRACYSTHLGLVTAEPMKSQQHCEHAQGGGTPEDTPCVDAPAAGPAGTGGGSGKLEQVARPKP